MGDQRSMYKTEYKPTEEQKRIALSVVKYQNDSKKSWAQISREAEVPEGQLRQIRNGKTITDLDVWERLRDYIEGSELPIRISDFCKGLPKLNINNPFDKEKLDERKLKFIQSYNASFEMCGVKLKDFAYEEDCKLFFIKSGICRISIDQLCFAIQDKYYKIRLEKAIQFRK